MDRRGFNKAMGLALAGGSCGVLSGCSEQISYEQLAADTWRHSSPRVSGSVVQTELVRYATLAANSHNTQPWRFRLEPNRITILPDFSRRCPVVDPDDHHVFATLGCATENLIHAAAAHGLAAQPTFVNGEIRIELDSAPVQDSELFQAIPLRQCTRADYDGKPVASDALSRLTSSDESVELRLFTSKADLESVLEYVVAGNTVQMRDEAFVAELKDWIRFSESAVVTHRDGLYSASSGNPTTPQWIGNLLFGMFFTEEAENDKYRDQLRSSAGVMAFVAAENDPLHWVEAGRAYQRFALHSTAMGLKHAFINQPIEVPEVRRQFADYLGIGERRPNLLVRFGYGPTLPRSLRRPVADVLVT